MLQVRRLAKSFGQLRAVDGVSFEIQPGTIFGLLGPNGAGKTTTLSMVCGLLRADSGEVLIGGHSFWSDPDRARRQLGVAPQDLALYEELGARDNLEFWGRLAGLDAGAARQRAGELLEALSLTERSRDAVRTYSGGMKRRVNLGIALMHRPRLLLLDEPTAGIDPQARANILEFIRGLRADGTAVLYTTHYLEEAESLCDRMAILDRGTLLAEGTLRELQQRLGEDHLFVLEGDLAGADPATWPGFTERFRLLQKNDRQLLAAARPDRDPAECLKELLSVPVPIGNVSLKRPSLNDVFLQLTGRSLRE